MSSGIVPYGSSSRLPRAVGQEMALSEQRAFTHATEVRAIEFVARVGLQAIADLPTSKANSLGRFLSLRRVSRPSQILRRARSPLS
jgi:hypothetical protein